jgi:hypothetical protein
MKTYTITGTAWQIEKDSGRIYCGLEVEFLSGIEVKCYATNRPEWGRAPGNRMRATHDGWTLTTDEPKDRAELVCARALIQDADSFLGVVRAMMEDEDRMPEAVPS